MKLIIPKSITFTCISILFLYISLISGKHNLRKHYRLRHVNIGQPFAPYNNPKFYPLQRSPWSFDKSLNPRVHLSRLRSRRRVSELLRSQYKFIAPPIDADATDKYSRKSNYPNDVTEPTISSSTTKRFKDYVPSWKRKTSTRPPLEKPVFSRYQDVDSSLSEAESPPTTTATIVATTRRKYVRPTAKARGNVNLPSWLKPRTLPPTTKEPPLFQNVELPRFEILPETTTTTRSYNNFQYESNKYVPSWLRTTSTTLPPPEEQDFPGYQKVELPPMTTTATTMRTTRRYPTPYRLPPKASDYIPSWLRTTSTTLPPPPPPREEPVYQSFEPPPPREIPFWLRTTVPPPEETEFPIYQPPLIEIEEEPETTTTTTTPPTTTTRRTTTTTTERTTRKIIIYTRRTTTPSTTTTTPSTTEALPPFFQEPEPEPFFEQVDEETTTTTTTPRPSSTIKWIPRTRKTTTTTPTTTTEAPQPEEAAVIPQYIEDEPEPYFEDTTTQKPTTTTKWIPHTRRTTTASTTTIPPPIQEAAVIPQFLDEPVPEERYKGRSNQEETTLALTYYRRTLTKDEQLLAAICPNLGSLPRNTQWRYSEACDRLRDKYDPEVIVVKGNLSESTTDSQVLKSKSNADYEHLLLDVNEDYGNQAAYMDFYEHQSGSTRFWPINGKIYCALLIIIWILQ